MEQEPKPEYLKGFNGGYLLAKHDPETYKLLIEAIEKNKDNEYFQGLHAGKKQHDREVLLEMAKQAQQNKAKDRGMGM